VANDADADIVKIVVDEVREIAPFLTQRMALVAALEQQNVIVAQRVGHDHEVFTVDLFDGGSSRLTSSM